MKSRRKQPTSEEEIRAEWRAWANEARRSKMNIISGWTFDLRKSPAVALVQARKKRWPERAEKIAEAKRIYAERRAEGWKPGEAREDVETRTGIKPNASRRYLKG